MAKKLVCDVGINDADYAVCPTINGKSVWCPFYAVWVSMLTRCYNKKFQVNRPTYIGCSVCDGWLVFSNFKKWMEDQSWEGKYLDKDLLVKDNKTYSPDACVFVDRLTNNFMTDCGAARGEWPIGACFDRRTGKFISRCSNHLTRDNEHLGYFASPEQAHLAWKRRKHELALRLAGLQTDQRVAYALRTRYL